MDISFTPPRQKRDVLAAMVSALKAGANLLAPNPFGAAAELGEFSKHLIGIKENAPENLAWIWFSGTVTLATDEFIRALGRKYKPRNIEAATTKFVEKAMKIEDNCRFGADALTRTNTHAVFASARSALIELILDLTGIGKFDESKGTKTHWELEFDRCLNRASAYMISAHHTHLLPLVEGTTGPASKAMRCDVAWVRHYDWIH